MSDFQRAMRYRMALDLWFARMFAARQNKEPFNEPRPTL